MSNYTVIDSDNYEAAGIKAFFFPGGEPHVKIPDFTDQDLLLFLKLRTWNDAGLAACLLDALNQQEYSDSVQIFIPYFPAGRQDRSDGFSPMTLGITAALLARGDMALFDPHSEHTEGLIASAHNALVGYYPSVNTWMPSDLDLTSLPEYDGVIAPDRGAAARAEDMAAALGDVEVIYAEKVREFGTGDITHYQIEGLHLGKKYLVVDDICDGGATFNLLAENVPHGVDIDLWVSHGIFSKGVDNLSLRYGTIYTTDSFYKDGFTHPDVKMLPLNQLFDRIMES